MNFRANKQRGETILEIVISMSVLTIGITLASTVMGSALRNMNASKNRVIAVNVAREGLEAMRNIRDTNWLKYSSKKRECWNHEPRPEPDDCADDTEQIQPGDYIIYKQDVMGEVGGQLKVIGWRWRLLDVRNNGQATAPACGSGNKFQTYFNTSANGQKAYVCNGEAWIELANLWLVDTDPLVDTNGDANFENDQDAYNHPLVPEGNAQGMDYAVLSTPFRRILTVEYLDNDGGVVSYPSSANNALNRMRVRVTVSWQEGKFPFKTDLVMHLTDHMERESLSY